MSRHLESRDWQMVIHCLRVAAERFTEHATAMRVTFPRLAEQFTQQANDARTLATQLEDAE